MQAKSLTPLSGSTWPVVGALLALPSCPLLRLACTDLGLPECPNRVFFGLIAIGLQTLYGIVRFTLRASRVQGADYGKSVHFIRFSSPMPRPDDPGGTLDTCHSPFEGASSGAGISITLVNLLPHDTFTRLYQPSGGCDPPCGLHDSLCTLQSCCFPILQPPRQPPGSCC
jgi:hypothetical protein